jgi:dipeptidyl aminopeptidase/acylaminoacyl peptidase
MVLSLWIMPRIAAQPATKVLSVNKINYSDLSFFKDLIAVNNKDTSFKDNYNQLGQLSFDSLVYTSDNYKILAYVIKPKQGDKLPCIIFNHGGNRNFGLLTPELMIRFLSKLAGNGFIVIASTYRGNVKSEGKDEFGGDDVHDVLNLIEVLNEFPQADTSRIGMYGWSRGGLMTYIALTKTKRIKTAVIGGSPSNFFDLIKERPLFEEKTLSQTIPNYYVNKENELFKRSPVKWTEKLPKIPLLIIHGEKDDRVSVSHASNMSQKLSAYNIPHKLVIYEHGDHNIKANREEMLNLVIEWFNTNLK